MTMRFVLLFLSLAAVATAQISISISQAGFGFPDNPATGGFEFGYVFDTGDDGFETGSYGPFDSSIALTPIPGSTDVFSFGDEGNQATFFFPPLGANAIGGSTNVLTPGTTGGQLGIIWFEEGASIAGSRYGFSVLSLTWGMGDTIDAPPNLANAGDYFTLIPEPSESSILISLAVLCSLAGFRDRRVRLGRNRPG